MRRLTPYLMLAVLVLGTGLGIGLGLSESPSTRGRTVVTYTVGPNEGVAVPRGSKCASHPVRNTDLRELVCSEPSR